VVFAPLETTRIRAVGYWLLGIVYFFLEARTPAHRRACAHYFSVISRL